MCCLDIVLKVLILQKLYNNFSDELSKFRGTMLRCVGTCLRPEEPEENKSPMKTVLRRQTREQEKTSETYKF